MQLAMELAAMQVIKPTSLQLLMLLVCQEMGAAHNSSHTALQAINPISLHWLLLLLSHEMHAACSGSRCWFVKRCRQLTMAVCCCAGAIMAR